jgi:hypothetical protein
MSTILLKMMLLLSFKRLNIWQILMSYCYMVTPVVGPLYSRQLNKIQIYLKMQRYYYKYQSYPRLLLLKKINALKLLMILFLMQLYTRFHLLWLGWLSLAKFGTPDFVLKNVRPMNERKNI